MEELNVPRTRPQNPIYPTKKEDISKIEKLLNQLMGDLSEIEEIKSVIDELILNTKQNDNKFKTEFMEYFDTFKEKTDQLITNLDKEVDYNRTLEAEINEAKASQQIKLLEKELLNERGSINSTLSNIEKLVKEKLINIEEKANTLITTQECVEKGIAIIRQEGVQTSKNELTYLKSECEKLIKQFTEQCQKTLDTMRKNSIKFLTECETENKTLIGKIPSVKEKFTFKDCCFYIVSLLSIFSLLYNIFL